MEVQTPILSLYGNTDPNLESLNTRLHFPSDSISKAYFLNTSPEFAMKRLLAAGTGSIYQICKVFRDNEAGELHEPEFTMLEWYREGYDHHDMMDEVSELLSRLGYFEVERKPYGEIFKSCAGLDPHTAGFNLLHEKAKYYGFASNTTDRSVLLDFIFSHGVAPALAGNRAVLLYDFPACQSSLAKIRSDSVDVAERFELFIDGVEIANGFNELTDANDQLSRFQMENTKRKRNGQGQMPVDINLIAGLEHGLPDCAGVAVGLDRLFMKMKGLSTIDKVLTFSVLKA